MTGITKEMADKAEAQIEAEMKNVDYDTREFTIEYIVDKYINGIENEDNELYVPDYQREFIWRYYRQSRFIESLILGIPIPLIFVAEIKDTGRLEIVDGSQRIRTLAAFLNNEFRLVGLNKLPLLNNFYFRDFPLSRQRKFKNTPMRMIVLSSKATPEVRNDMFDRINTSSVPLCPMEKRKGVYIGKFNDFIFSVAENEQFKKICPISIYFKDRQEEAELILRFFGFSDTYPDFVVDTTSLEKTGVANFLDKYMEIKNKTIDDNEIARKKEDFLKMIGFVEKTFPERGFAKYRDSEETSRSYFEAIAIGSHFALKENPNLVVNDIKWSHLDKNNPNELFRILSGRYHTHKPAKLKERIDYVKNEFLQRNKS
ncbi:Uncharacterized protein dnl_21680 [Desulfonema limicola]|uniref:GmrSD restriction endonucleases N-terminal domain-containing protein n=1 Tax=Desulfonema limicola TaxID=45656 RepID=A0A975GG15_9BACT|nr:DUF262 domain-containing protein [Desulfonema limicola]QTA79886.1 Uncharacterized protein dnl_21680 [Desulfonema limicola]